MKLVIRGSRFGGLTPEGQRALIRARQIVGDTRRLREEMRRIERHDLAPYLPANPQQLDDIGTEVHYLGYYLKWHPQSRRKTINEWTSRAI